MADTGHDTLVINGVHDVVHASGGDTPNTNILGSLQLVFNGAVTCVGGSGAGTNASPYVGATSCTLPFGTSIQTNSFSEYTVQPGDFALANHRLTDTATLDWHNTCAFDPDLDCTPDPQLATAGSSSLIEQLPTTTTTVVRNGAGQAVTTVEAGTSVHDFVTVAGQPGQPVPTGNVTIDWFLNGTCAGNPAVNSGSLGPLVNGQLDATGFAFTPGAGQFAFRAHYLGDAIYTPSDGPCEPLTVVDANIQISPPEATNRVGQVHTFTGHVNVNDGNGLVNAPAGTLITFSIVSGPGGFVGGVNTCTTIGATGSCTVQLTSAVTGLTTVRAATDVTVGGLSLHRQTGDGHAGDSADATKTWVDAAITITPSATNEVGHEHTFVVTLVKDAGNGAGFVAAAGEHVDFTLTNSDGATFTLNAAASTCDDAGANTNAAGQCTIVINSTTPGKVTAHASSTLSVAGSAPFTVQTDGVAPNSGDAVKTYVDANIQITPAEATNPVGTNHTLTGHVNIDAGDGAGYVNAPAGTLITFTLLPGSVGSFVGGVSTCTTIGTTGSCTVQITSAVGGTSTVRAATDVTVGGISLHRQSGDGKAGDSADAVKHWGSAKIAISIAPNATNEVGQPHTFTVTLQKDTGSGFVAAAGEHVDFTLTNSNGAAFVLNAAASTCDDAGANTNAAGQCTIVFTSPTAGKVTGHASATLTINGATIHVETDGTNGNSGNAVKTFVDANIQLTPATATNPVGTNHTLHCHINVNDGSGAGFVNAPAGTVCTVNILSGPGTPATQNCSTVGATGTCDVVITSAAPGTSTLQATTTVSVGGVALTRTTGDTHAGDSATATKLWADDVVATKVRDAANNDITNSTTVTPGTVVHDEASVTKAAGAPAGVPDPTGTVSFTLYDNGTCNGNVVATDPNKPLAAGIATSAAFTTPAAGGAFSYLAHYNGDANYPAHNGPCEPFTVQAQHFAPALTPGFWKNHEAATTALLPITLGNYNVNTFAKARAVFDAMKCSSPIDCLAGHLLAAKLDLASGSNPSITPIINQADALLIAVNYAGPGNFTTPTAAQKALALQLEVLIDNYTNQ